MKLPAINTSQQIRFALNWWDSLEKCKRMFIENKTFGTGSYYECNTITERDILKMYQQSNTLTETTTK